MRQQSNYKFQVQGKYPEICFKASSFRFKLFNCKDRMLFIDLWKQNELVFLLPRVLSQCLHWMFPSSPHPWWVLAM
jgi:hypothetical protein